MLFPFMLYISAWYRLWCRDHSVGWATSFRWHRSSIYRSFQLL